MKKEKLRISRENENKQKIHEYREIKRQEIQSLAYEMERETHLTLYSPTNPTKL